MNASISSPRPTIDPSGRRCKGEFQFALLNDDNYINSIKKPEARRAHFKFLQGRVSFDGMTTTCAKANVSNANSDPMFEPLAVVAARAACALGKSIEALVLASDQNLGRLEVQAARDVQEFLRQAVERGAQAKADASLPVCPVCGHKLTRLSPGHPRTFTTRFGDATIKRTRGYCKGCGKWRTPADTTLGLEETAGYSPAVQDMAAQLASKMPVEEAGVVLEHLTGVKRPRATLDREARRQGERAQALRRELDKKAAPEKKPLELVLEPCQRILQLDAWNIRERDHWGKSAALRGVGKDLERWHWVYTGTRFRLDPRGQRAGGRPILSERGFVATRVGIDALREQLHAEALRRGLGGWRTTVFQKHASDWIFTMRGNLWRRWGASFLARTRRN
jgi:hypothetical protein